ncbi:MAG: GGDEF domain-containing protein, partial [Polaromonas sp.]|nr:GGDEF domain-containing protein [Polaromonas sp.]
MIPPTSTALAQADRHLAMAERFARIGSWTLDLRRPQPIAGSAEFAALLGLAPQASLTLGELAGRFAPDCRDRADGLLLQCCRQGIGFDEELQLDTPSGRQRVRLACQAVLNRRGQVTGLQGL